MAYIYVLKNKINGKMYVGQTVNIKQRLKQHRTALRKQAISLAIKKHGWYNFDKIFFKCPMFLLDFVEKALIKIFNTISPNGYNLNNGGHINKKFSIESKNKMSNTHKGKKLSEETKLKISVKNTGRVVSQETREKLSKIHKNKIVTEETKKKLSLSHIGQKSWDAGRKFPEFSGENCSKSKKIICIETNTVYISVTEAAKLNNIHHKRLRYCCKKFGRMVEGFHWMYYEDYLKINQDNQGVA